MVACYVYADRRLKSSPPWATAFAAGCRGLVVESDALKDGDIAMFGSVRYWPVLQAAIQAGRTWFYGDHASFDRHRYRRYRITRNGYQPDGCRAASPDLLRARDLVVRPWRRVGRHVLICPHTDTFYRLHGADGPEWLSDVQAALARATDRPLRVRRKCDARPLAEDLVDAWAVVVWASSAAVEALLAGVPIVVTAPWASTARMSSTIAGIETPYYPDDRESFLASVAASEWTLDEMASGQAWHQLVGAA